MPVVIILYGFVMPDPSITKGTLGKEKKGKNRGGQKGTRAEWNIHPNSFASRYCPMLLAIQSLLTSGGRIQVLPAWEMIALLKSLANTRISIAKQDCVSGFIFPAARVPLSKFLGL